MRILKWIVVGGIVMLAVPSDEQGQARFARTAAETFTYLSTTCERHKDACIKAGKLWVELRAKAEFAGKLALDLALDRGKAPQTSPSTQSAHSAPHYPSPIPADVFSTLSAPVPPERYPQAPQPATAYRPLDGSWRSGPTPAPSANR